jgi:hypothetical protein
MGDRMKERLRLWSAAGALVCVGMLAAALQTGSPASRAAVFHHPRIPVSAGAKRAAGWASSNWSGYAISGSAFNSVTGQWTVPGASQSRKATYSSNWIGIDGFNDSSLIQTGTESDYYNGSTHYYVWWEILPAPETVIPSISVTPGDVITASITHGSGSAWTIAITDKTKNKSFSTTKTYTGPQTSAEWIEEAPSLGGHVTTLANYGQATFNPGTVNGLNPGLTAGQSGVMVQKGVQISTPSNPNTHADGFNVAYGSKAPLPPN